MKCVRCQKDLPEKSNFCVYCRTDQRTKGRKRDWFSLPCSCFLATVVFIIPLLLLGIILFLMGDARDFYKMYIKSEDTRKSLEMTQK